MEEGLHDLGMLEYAVEGVDQDMAYMFIETEEELCIRHADDINDAGTAKLEDGDIEQAQDLYNYRLIISNNTLDDIVACTALH